MITNDLLGALRRRWYLVLLGLATTAGLLWAALPMVPVTYQAEALVVVLPPHNLEGIGGNPYLALGGLDSVTGVLGKAMTTDEVVREVRKDDRGVEYTVEPDATVSGPVLLITVEAKTPGSALDATRRLADIAPREMLQLQRSNGVKPESYITTNLITRDSKAAPQQKARIRAALALGVGGLASTLMGVALADGLLLRRRERRSLRVVETTQEERVPEAKPAPAADTPQRARGSGKPKGGPTGRTPKGGGGGGTAGGGTPPRGTNGRPRKGTGSGTAPPQGGPKGGRGLASFQVSPTQPHIRGLALGSEDNRG